MENKVYWEERTTILKVMNLLYLVILLLYFIVQYHVLKPSTSQYHLMSLYLVLQLAALATGMITKLERHYQPVLYFSSWVTTISFTLMTFRTGWLVEELIFSASLLALTLHMIFNIESLKIFLSAYFIFIIQGLFTANASLQGKLFALAAYGLFAVMYFMKNRYEYRLNKAYQQVNGEKTALLDNANEAFMLLELLSNDKGVIIDYRLKSVNNSFIRMTGHEKQEVIDRKLSVVCEKSGQMWANVFKQVHNSQNKKFAGTIFDEDMDAFYKVSAFMVNEIQIAVMFMDVTERVRHEQNLQTSMARTKEINTLKTQFLRDVNHRIRTPLNGMMGMMQLIDYTQLEEEDQEAFEAMASEMKHFRNIINQISEYVEVQDMPVRVASNSIFETVREVLGGFKESGNQFRVISDMYRSQHYIFDRHIVSTVLRELVLNAVKYSEGTDVEINLTYCEKTPKSGPCLHIMVRDYGIGIPKERLSLIFNEMYHHDFINIYRDEYEISLPICRQMMLLLGGDLVVESELDKGSAFTLILPVD